MRGKERGHTKFTLSSQNIGIMTALVTRDFRDGHTTQKSVLAPIDLILQHTPSDRVGELVYRGKHLTAFDIPRDILCILAPKGSTLCYATSRDQYAAEAMATKIATASTVLISTTVGYFGLVGQIKAGLTALGAMAFSMWSDTSKIQEFGERTVVSTMRSNWIRCLTQRIHHAVSSSAVLYQREPLPQREAFQRGPFLFLPAPGDTTSERLW